MLQGRWGRAPLIVGGVALAAVIVGWAGRPSPDAAGRAPSVAADVAQRPLPGPSVPAFGVAEAAAPQPRATAAFTANVTPAVAAAATAAITVSAPRRLQVGELQELVVAVGANAGFGEIGFTVQFDPNVLQVRAGSDGGWAAIAGQATDFSAAISDAEDRVQIRSVAVAARAGIGGGRVAILQFQAVAPGATSVIVSDMRVLDRAGALVAAVVSASNLQITVE